MSKMNIGYYLEKLFLMDEKLGGTARIEKGEKGGDEFTILKEGLLKIFHQIGAKVQEKTERLDQLKSKKATEIVKLDVEISELLVTAQALLERMNEYLRKEVKKGATKEYSTQQKLYLELRQQLNALQDMESTELYAGTGKTISDLISQRRMQGKEAMMELTGQRNFTNETSDQAKQAILEYKDKDKIIDQKIDVINQGILEWKDKVAKMQDAIASSTKQIDVVTTEVDKTNTEIEFQNKKLKNVIYKLRAPHKFCLDIILVILLVGIGAFIWMMLKNKKK